MNPSLQRLMNLVPPPAAPVAPGSSDAWKQVEQEMGTPLPQDFKDYTQVYGAGQWADFFGVMNPFYLWKHPEASKSWKAWFEKRFEGFSELQKEYPRYQAPFRVFPEPNGVLAFGYDDNGGTLCWQTSGNPDSWRIVCLDGKTSERYDSFDMNLTGFLDALLHERISPNTFAPDFFPIRQPAFRPYTTE
jgi:hypothetical protein